MSSLDAFEEELLTKIERPSKLRPFVCDGSPLEARVCIVGFNPASQMDADFWEFWVPGVGFDKARWFAEYKRDRAARPLKPGKKSRPAVSPSRRNIERVVEALHPYRCLETNLFAYPTPSAASLASVHRDPRLFRWLMGNVRPDILIVHGKDAAKELDGIDVAAEIKVVPHFSRQWSYERAYALGIEVREWLDARGGRDRLTRLPPPHPPR